MDRLAKLQHKAIGSLVDSQLDLVVLYAVGDAGGLSAGEIKIGVSTRQAFREEIKKMSNYRSSDLVIHMQTIISGREEAVRLKTAALATFDDRGLTYRSWRRANGDEVRGIISKLAATYGVRLMTEEQAAVLERETFERINAQGID